MRMGATLRDLTATTARATPIASAPATAPTGASPKQQGGGFFRQGGMGRTLAGIIGDTLLQQSGMARVYAPMQQAQQQAKQAEAQWTRRREADRADQQWEWANRPAPQRAPNDFESALEGSGVVRGSPQWAEAMRRRAENILNPDPQVTMTLPNGQMYVGPRSGLATAMGGGATPATPTAPVGRLTPVNGGPTQPASGNFRP